MRGATCRVAHPCGWRPTQAVCTARWRRRRARGRWAAWEGAQETTREDGLPDLTHRNGQVYDPGTTRGARWAPLVTAWCAAGLGGRGGRRGLRRRCGGGRVGELLLATEDEIQDLVAQTLVPRDGDRAADDRDEEQLAEPEAPLLLGPFLQRATDFLQRLCGLLDVLLDLLVVGQHLGGLLAVADASVGVAGSLEGNPDVVPQVLVLQGPSHVGVATGRGGGSTRLGGLALRHLRHTPRIACSRVILVPNVELQRSSSSSSGASSDFSGVASSSAPNSRSWRSSASRARSISSRLGPSLMATGLPGQWMNFGGMPSWMRLLISAASSRFAAGWVAARLTSRNIRSRTEPGFVELAPALRKHSSTASVASSCACSARFRSPSSSAIVNGTPSAMNRSPSSR